ncbi:MULTISPECIES: uridine kinase [unclassified Crossiella]|uniref:uridine kinase n=1 Tax=unclassified Crossiella TaxID=2620835 RepID=UPI001FFF152F|nr:MULTISPECIES: uridine kinase [unclassified Crossiella]MCK2239926.1 uridine kinase [Crossiella sp. S99.2]MCK2252634.1 uridine kinase [Crossiella sp. S99.1]
MRVRPVSFDALVTELAERIATLPPHQWARVAIDGAAAAHPEHLADALVEPLRVHGRPVQRVSAADFLRPASLRLEQGHQDPDSFYLNWLDTNALRREVLDPLSPNGSGQVLPTLRNPHTDRSTRAVRVPLPPGGVLLLDGPLLLGQGLPLDLTVHLRLSDPALARRTPESAHWTLPAFKRYTEEVNPESLADIVIRQDNPAHPALVDP